MWGIRVSESKKYSFLQTCRKMYKHGGWRPFVTGTFATVTRDMTFGGCFSLIRHSLHSNIGGGASNSGSSSGNGDRIQEHKFLIDMIAAICGTIVSSPMNYVRNIHYATHPSEKLQSTGQILGDLWRSAVATDSLFFRMLFMQHQLRIGWGTLRVGCGMAVGGKIYSMAVNMFASDNNI
jgi:hypothetical protein